MAAKTSMCSMKLWMSLLQITIWRTLKKELTIASRGWENHCQSKVRKNIDRREKYIYINAQCVTISRKHNFQSWRKYFCLAMFNMVKIYKVLVCSENTLSIIWINKDRWTYSKSLQTYQSLVTGANPPLPPHLQKCPRDVQRGPCQWSVPRSSP